MESSPRTLKGENGFACKNSFWQISHVFILVQFEKKFFSDLLYATHFDLEVILRSKYRICSWECCLCFAIEEKNDYNSGKIELKFRLLPSDIYSQYVFTDEVNIMQLKVNCCLHVCVILNLNWILYELSQNDSEKKFWKV